MTKLPAYKGKDVEIALLKKGFKKGNKHHKFLTFFVDGKKTNVRTKISHGSKTYVDYLATCLKRDLKVGNSELSGLIECPMSEADYLEHLQKAGFI